MRSIAPLRLIPAMPDTPQPPQAPSVPRRIAFHRGNAVGLAIILLIVVLALLGAFGTSTAQVQADAGPVDISVSYPSLIRYKMVDQLEVSIAVGSQAVEDVSVAISSGYLGGFSTVAFQPEVDLTTRDVTVIRVDDLAPHETRVVTGSVQAEHYWLHEGWLEVRSGDESLARVPLATFVFP